MHVRVDYELMKNSYHGTFENKGSWQPQTLAPPLEEATLGARSMPYKNIHGHFGAPFRIVDTVERIGQQKPMTEKCL